MIFDFPFSPISARDISQLLFKQNTTVIATFKIKQQETECCFEETFLTENEYLKQYSVNLSLGKLNLH